MPPFREGEGTLAEFRSHQPGTTPVTAGARAGALESPAEVQAMFDRIAGRYDLMNCLMSGGCDRRWRALAAREALSGGAQSVLDVATGTGALARALHQAGAISVVGIDRSTAMLDIAARRTPPGACISLRYGDALDLPFSDASFDACTIGFGLRNLPDFQAGLHEMARVLRAGGRLVVLELSPPSRPLFGPLFEIYFGKLVPLVGWLVTGDREAYRYLPESLRAFPDAYTLARMMSRAGLVDIRWRFLGGSSVALHVGIKP
jgi:demethylmenaquinone methyltransferase/2-methoxy-6-polyprenyl-1,4-benzoquinol methylase